MERVLQVNGEKRSWLITELMKQRKEAVEAEEMSRHELSRSKISVDEEKI